MIDKDIKIGIVGAGSLGAVFAVILCKAGYDVELARFYPSQIVLGNNVAISISGQFGENDILVPSVDGVDNFTSKKDYIFILTKAYDAKFSAEISVNFLKDDGKIVLLQNLFTAQEITKIIDPTRLFALVVEWCAIRKGEANFEVVRDGQMAIGSLSVCNISDLERLQSVLNSITHTRICDNIIGATYSRLLLNSCVASVGAITGYRLGKMLEYHSVEKLFTSIIREGLAVAEAMNLKVTMYANKVEWHKVGQHNLGGLIYRKALYFKLRVANPYTVSSCLRNIEISKRSEIEYLNGFFCKMGKAFNVETPVNDRLVKMVQEIEMGKRHISLSNLKDYYLRHPKKYLIYEKENRKENRYDN